MILLKNYLKRLRSHGKGQKDLPFGLLITGDEELGGFNGAGKALKRFQTDFCIVLDGGGLEKIVVKENGIVRIKFVAKSRSAAGERTGLRKNAIEMLIDDFVKLRTYFVTSAPEHPHKALILNSIQAESNHRIPQYAEALLEILYTATDNMEKLFKKLQTEFNSEMVVEYIEPVFSSGKSPHLDLLLDTAKQTRIGFEDGANDSRFLAQRGITGIIWGADGDGSRHSENEHVDIESVYELYSLLDLFVKRSETLKS
jgi:succinyl-diaminopimelate desuccinylase